MRKLRDSIPLTLEKAAELSDLSKSGISKLEGYETPDKANGSTLTLLARVYLGNTATGDDLLEAWKNSGKTGKSKGKGKTHGRGVPVLGNISASGLVEMFDDRHGTFDEFIPCPTEYAPDAFALRVVGDSMMPKYAAGDRVVFTPTKIDDVRPGEDCYIQLDGEGKGESSFKRVLMVRPGVLLLLPLNSNFKPIEVEIEHVIRVAVATGFFRAMSRPPASTKHYG